jgi:predicted CXXCH cytochrome family protein
MLKTLLKIVLLFQLITFVSLIYAQQNNDECLSCHQELDDELLIPAQNYVNDIHYKMNITCSGCHGGDATTDDDEIAMSKEKGFIGVPKRIERYKICTSCHSDEQKMKRYSSNIQVDQYKKLENSVHFQPSNNNEGPIADCVTCHSVHDIKSVDDPGSKVYPTKVVKLCGSCHSNANFMKNYNASLPVDQVIKYKTSKHGMLNAKGDPNVAECASCHGHHEIYAVNDSRSHVYATNIPKVCSSCHSDSKLMSKYGLPSDQFESYVSSVHGIALLEKQDISAPSCNDCHGNHGAVPPGVESISKVCGSCHVLNMELFEKSPHQKAFDENDFPECETCHGNHKIRYVTDDMVGTQESAVCMDCHDASDDNKGYYVAGQMKSLIDSLKTEDKVSKEILEEATQKGMDVTDAEFLLKDVRQVLIQTRTSIHTFDIDKFKESIKPGFETVSKVKQEGVAAVDEYYFRRMGLGIATIIVTILVFGLYFKIRKMESKT